MEYPKDEKGRCRSCGFLCRRLSRRNTGPGRGNYAGIDEAEREAGGAYKFGFELYCYRRENDLDGEVGAAVFESDSEESAVLEVIGLDRKCKKWFSFLPDLEPTDHIAELRLAEVQKLAQRQLAIGVVSAIMATLAVTVSLSVGLVAFRSNMREELRLAESDREAVVATVTMIPEKTTPAPGAGELGLPTP